MAKHGKKYRDKIAQIDTSKKYTIDEAVGLVKEASFTKFDGSVDVAINLGVDPRHADQMVRGALVLPHGIGKTVRILVFAEGDKAKEAEEAGADFVGGQELVNKIKEGWLDFDKAIATPGMMRFVGQIGKILGPRGLMPNPKVGTVTMEISRAVGEMKAGRVEFRVDKAGIVHAPLGRVSFEQIQLSDNLRALLDTLQRIKPQTAKGRYVRAITLSPTMGVGIGVDVLSLDAPV